MIHSQNYLSRAPIHLVIAALMAVTSHDQATLTPITAANGAELVYSSVSNATWTADTNLLGTLMQRNGFEAMARAIIAVTPSFVTTTELLRLLRRFSAQPWRVWFEEQCGLQLHHPRQNQLVWRHGLCQLSQ